MLFLGNSITFAGGYIDYFEAFLRTQYPRKQITLINRGMPSETIAGTSEETHIPPRPYLFNRLDAVLHEIMPDFVIACYGMNDGIYQPFQDELFHKFQNGVRQLEHQLRENRIEQFRMLTPPPFEYQFFSTIPDTFSTFDYRNPSPDYNQTLEKYSQWMVQTLPEQTLQIHHSLQSELTNIQDTDGNFTLTVDGIHPNTIGHWLMTDQIIHHFDLLLPAPLIEFDIAQGEIISPVLSAETRDDRLRINVLLNHPAPFDTTWHTAALAESGYFQNYNTVRVQIRNLSEGEYVIVLAGDTLDTLERDHLNTGVVINLLDSEQLKNRSTKLLQLVREKRALEKDLWISGSTHYRLESMKQQRSVDKRIYKMKTDSLDKRITKIARPDTVSLRILSLD